MPTEEKEKEMAESIEKSNEGMVRIPSHNFGETIICGSNAQAAAEYLMQQPYLSKSTEIMLHQKIKKDFNVTISRYPTAILTKRVLEFASTLVYNLIRK